VCFDCLCVDAVGVPAAAAPSQTPRSAHPFGPKTVNYDLQMVVVCPETRQKLVSTVTCSGCKPCVDVSLKHLQFGDCEVGDHRDVLITVKNPGTTLPLDFALNKVCLCCALGAVGRVAFV
jgi:hypothetical protein